MFSPDRIREIVEKGLPGSRAEVKDLTGTSDHFELVVIAAGFDGKSLVDRHRMVYATLGALVGNEIHALSIRALTPGEAGGR